MYAAPHPPSPSRRRRTHRLARAATLLAAAGLAGTALAGCGGSGSGAGSTPTSAAPTTSSSASPVAAGTTIRVRVDGDTVSPRNDRIQVPVGEPLTLRVVSDRKGELHVHSSPETTFDFGSGTSTKTFTISRPGIVELEEHVSDTLVAQLEAR